MALLMDFICKMFKSREILEQYSSLYLLTPLIKIFLTFFLTNNVCDDCNGCILLFENAEYSISFCNLKSNVQGIKIYL